jgi:hypothetical protein
MVVGSTTVNVASPPTLMQGGGAPVGGRPEYDPLNVSVTGAGVVVVLDCGGEVPAVWSTRVLFSIGVDHTTPAATAPRSSARRREIRALPSGASIVPCLPVEGGRTIEHDDDKRTRDGWSRSTHRLLLNEQFEELARWIADHDDESRVFRHSGD